MKTHLRLLFVAGARPNFMKIAPLLKAAEQQAREATGDEPRMECRLVHTGQHYDAQMSQVFFDQLGIPAPDFNLEVGSGSHAVQTARIMERFEPVLLRAFDPPVAPESGAVPPRAEARGPIQNGRPDWLVVVGDVNSTMACTLVASKLGVRIAHVEAGLRSFDRAMPEEINRIVTDALADLLLTPSEDANLNLRREGIPESKIQLVGNIMIDALLANLDRARKSCILDGLGVKPGGFVYVTLHRPSNVDDPPTLLAIMRELEGLSGRYPVIFPIHPRTRKQLADCKVEFAPGSRLRIIDPISYHDSLFLAETARLVLTDSGGLQEETTFFRTPCLTLRPNTERPITATMGSNRLTSCGTLPGDLVTVLRAGERLGTVPPLWDGRTGERVIQALLKASGLDSSAR